MSDVKVRHPEKAHKPDNPVARKPDWIRVKAPVSREYHETRKLMRALGLNTVCEEAACPNIGECWSKKHATVMILGDVCTRACAFCNVATGLPDKLDPHEPAHVGEAVAALGLSHIVITSVDRDDLDDGGAAHFAETIEPDPRAAPATTIEVLTPDFLRKPGAVEQVVAAKPDVFNHNLETVPRLYPQSGRVRAISSLQLLATVKALDPSLFTKSGLMVGLGEKREEVFQVMDDMRVADVDFLTIGQYLQPTPKHHPVERFVPPEEFQELKRMAEGKGFLLVSASPLTRSSYHAGEDFERLRTARASNLAAADAAHAEQRLLGYTPAQLFELVADVERYPEFLPWCIGARIRERRPTISWPTSSSASMIRERFTPRSCSTPRSASM